MYKSTFSSLCNHRQLLYSRRDVLQKSSCGFGWLAFSLLAGRIAQSAASSESTSGAKNTTGSHFPAKAKRVIFICLKGGPSHVDTFDYKPELTKQNGKDAVRPGSKWMGSPWKFIQKGESGLWISELFPHLSEHTDKLCMIHSMQTDVPAHAQAMVRMHTGSSQFVRPSIGAWTLYGLGSENENLPGFISISPAGGSGGVRTTEMVSFQRTFKVCGLVLNRRMLPIPKLRILRRPLEPSGRKWNWISFNR